MGIVPANNKIVPRLAARGGQEVGLVCAAAPIRLPFSVKLARQELQRFPSLRDDFTKADYCLP